MKTRLISTLVLLPVALTAIVVGNWAYILLILIATSTACFEYVYILSRKSYSLAFPLVEIINLLWLASALWEPQPWFDPALAILTLLTITWSLYQYHNHPQEFAAITQWALTLAGGTYIGIGGAHLLKLRLHPEGLWWTLTALPIIWVGESVAYFVGKAWGQHKIAPNISPGKSWEGYFGEIISGTLSGALLGWLWATITPQPIHLSLQTGFLLGLCLSTLTTTGDFFISMIKRETGVKDTSKLIPGHGGVLDRIDSLLWAGIISWLIITLLK